MTSLKNLFFLMIMVTAFSLPLWGCGETESDKTEIIPDNEAAQVEESTALKAGDLSDKGEGMPEQESPKDIDLSTLDPSSKSTEEKSVMPGKDGDAPPEVIEIKSPAFEKYKKGSVNLSHLKHFAEYNVACIDCHHDYQDGRNVWIPSAPVQPCSSCHDPKETKGDVKKLQIAYHANCKNCHKEMIEADKSEDAPYKKCGDCHGDKD